MNLVYNYSDLWWVLFYEQVRRWLAIFHSAGKTPSLKEVSNRWLRGTAKLVAQCLSSIFGIPSGPVVVVGVGCFEVCSIVYGKKPMLRIWYVVMFSVLMQ